MKLNKLERFTAYVLILVEYKRNKDPFMGVCHAVEEIFGIDVVEVNQPHFPLFRQLFPELIAKADYNEYEQVYLFRSRRSRIAALKACIEETHP